MENIPKSIKILIVSLLVIVTGIGLSFISSKDDYDTITLENGKVLNFRDYSYSKDLNVKGFINSFDSDIPEKTVIATLTNKTLESKNITYPKEIQERVLNQKKFNSFDYYQDFVLIVLPYDKKIDYDNLNNKVKTSNKNIFFAEEIYDDMMYNIFNLYSANNKSNVDTDNYFVFEVKDGKVVESFNKTTDENINKILK